MPALRLLIADDHDVLRRGVRALIETSPNWRVVAEARDGHDAVAKARELKPDVAILDFGMPGLNGLDATKEIAKGLPKTKVLILTVYDSDELIWHLRQAGAHGYVHKRECDHELVPAIHSVVKEGSFYPNPSATVTPTHPKGIRRKIRPQLTQRQKEILSLLARGSGNEKIARTLSISVKTVETHRRHLLSRTESSSTAELVRYAIRNGIIEA